MLARRRQLRLLPARGCTLAQYLERNARTHEVWASIIAHPESWRIRAGETAGEARDRLNVQGLGMAKLSFALALLCPTVADVACCDRHIQRWATGSIRNTLPVKTYANMERSIGLIGERYGVSAFVAQWTIWDWQRGREETHAIIADERKGDEDAVPSGAVCTGSV